MHSLLPGRAHQSSCSLGTLQTHQATPQPVVVAPSLKVPVILLHRLRLSCCWLLPLPPVVVVTVVVVCVFFSPTRLPTLGQQIATSRPSPRIVRPPSSSPSPSCSPPAPRSQHLISRIPGPRRCLPCAPTRLKLPFSTRRTLDVHQGERRASTPKTRSRPRILCHQSSLGCRSRSTQSFCRAWTRAVSSRL